VTLQPFWLAYAIILVALYVWAARLVNEAKRRDSDTAEREIAPLMRSIERERDRE
jgi:hypothetical protein